MQQYAPAFDDAPGYRSLAAFIRDVVDRGLLPLGTKLPSERVLSEWIDSSRTTVRTAYQVLEEAGYAETRPNVGTVIVASIASSKDATATFRRSFARHSAEGPRKFLLDLMRSSEQFRHYGFDAGMADPELLPLYEFQVVLEELLTTRIHEALAYGLTEGQLALRERIVEYLRRYRHITDVGPENILITTGSMQALNLIATAFTEPGDAVAVEDPTFPGALLIFKNAQAELIPVALDDQGMNVPALLNVLRRRSGSRCKLIYTQPTLQNPTGVTMSVARRKQLCEICVDQRSIVIEDDAYGILDTDTDRSALFATRGDTPMIYVGSFSKLIAPGLRVGFAVADVGVIRQLALLKQVADLHSSGLSQLLIEGWLATGDVGAYIQRCRDAYAVRLREALNDPLFRDDADVPLQPNGGFYIFGKFKNHRSSKSVRDIAQKVGISFALGEYFAVKSDLRSSFRLSVSTLSKRSIHVGLLRLRQALRQPF